MTLYKFSRTDDYAFLIKLLKGNAVANKALIKSYFDTSIYYGDTELLQDMFNVVDRRAMVSGLQNKTVYLFLKAISPFSVTETDTRYDEPDIDWSRSYLRLFWSKMIDELKTDKNKKK
jgi:hypothetical protein